MAARVNFDCPWGLSVQGSASYQQRKLSNGQVIHQIKQFTFNKYERKLLEIMRHLKVFFEEK